MKTKATPDHARFLAFTRSLFAQAIARAFTEPPDIPIWQWADEKPIWLQSEDAAEPGPYRSAKTPWTRRLQELARRPFMWVWDLDRARWTRVRVTEVNIQKSTQSGFTEAILNFIRWIASFAPRNVIYLVDSQDQGKKIARRLLRSFARLDPHIFSGDPDDLKALEFILRGMEIIFGGSFSGTTTAQKQAPVVVSDEIEEHKTPIGDDTSATRNLKYRKKTSTGGIQFNLSKPKLEGGPIHKLFQRGNQEEFHIACPHCHYLQPIIPAYQDSCSETTEHHTPFSDRYLLIHSHTEKVVKEISGLEVGKAKNGIADLLPHKKSAPAKDYILLPKPLPLGETRKIKTGRLVYKHCKDLLGRYDMLRVLHDTRFECGQCGQAIPEHLKQDLALQAARRDPHHLGWLPTALGSPGIVSQHIGDMLSLNEESAWGEIGKQIIEAKSESRSELQGVINNIFGNVWHEELSKTAPDDIRASVAGKTLWFLDYQTDRGTRRDTFDTEEQARATHQALVRSGLTEISPPIPSYCKPYKRGTIPFLPGTTILGSDVGGNYARWVLIAALPNLIDAAVIDWGDELDPETIGEIMLTGTFPCLADGKKRRIGHGFIDAKFRKTEVLRVCWHVFKNGGHRLIPVAGIGGTAARGVRVWSYTPISGYRGKAFNAPAFKKLDFNDREAKNDLYIGCIGKKQRRIYYPIELGQLDKNLAHDERQFIAELCGEQLIEDRHGRKNWADPSPAPNHYGDSLKNAITGLRFLTKKHHLIRGQPAPPSDDPPAEAEESSQK